jgi:PAS domain S-box-containing protein
MTDVAPGTKKQKKKKGPDSLRTNAEMKLAKQPAESMAAENREPEKLIHELRVHQIELEMQNEALRESQSALEVSRDEYLDLYDFAPTGYLTLTNKAIIEKANLTISSLLGFGRRDLIKNRFRKFVVPEDLWVWDRYFISVLHSAEKQTCDLHFLKGDGSRFHVRIESRRIEREKEDPEIRMMISDITVEKRVEERLKIFQTFAENARDIILFVRKRDGKIIEANLKATEVYGFSHHELLNTTIFALGKSDPHELVEQQMADADTTGILFETIHRRKDGSDLPVEVNTFSLHLDGEPVFLSIVRDITERKRADTFRQLSVMVLEILNEPAEFREVVQRVLDAIKNATNADGAGIRLTVGDDFPYFVQDGFSRDFLLKENTLVVGDQDHRICRDFQGNVSLECTCGQVISGKRDPKNPFFTPGGSFWTNNSLLNPAETDDEQFHPRNACIHKGFASVAIIPIRKNPKQVIGTLQIDAFRKNCFTPDIVQSLELIAGQIGEALMRKHAEEEVRRLNEDRKTLIDNVPAMIWYKDTCNNFIRINPAGARTIWQTGRSDRGKKCIRPVPGGCRGLLPG